MSGRFAPSPTSDLHVGNLRTALLAWLFARSSGRGFLVRIEDLDTARVAAAGGVASRILDDLAVFGIDWDGPVVRQSERFDIYADALARLETYECFCTRREIDEASSAPHADGYRSYPGTCRDLTAAQRDLRRRTRPAALRVRAHGEVVTITDVLHGTVSGVVDDFVVRRGNGDWAYNLAVVADDGAQGVDQVVRGDDLLSSSPRQAWLATRLGFPVPLYAHVGLAVNRDGVRLAKRDGAVTLTDLNRVGVTPARVLSILAASLGLAGDREDVTASTLLSRFDPTAVPVAPWSVPARLS